MMGSQGSAQEQLFYSFSLDAQVPRDHLLRGIDRFLDLGELRQHLAPFYSHTGRPSIDPELMVRMLIVGYCMGIRSERRLCEEADTGDVNMERRRWCARQTATGNPSLGSLPPPVATESRTGERRRGR